MSATDETIIPTPAVGQIWHSNAFPVGDGDGRVEVLGTIDAPHFGLLVVSHLVRGDYLQAENVERFLRERTYLRSVNP